MTTVAVPRELAGLQEYEILAPIAEGSMARVYKARRRSDGTLVAIKVPLPAVVGNSVLRERFRNEYKAGKSLNHPNIVRALDFGQEGATYYLVMEFIEGEDLWQRINREGRLPEKDAVEILIQAARGLHEAHKHGIIHRDVKPDNILLTRDGRVKMADLGLIKDLEAEINLTCPNKGLGTPNFIAPEQFTEARHADVRCDIYSLGATLYMAVTGEMPFKAPNVAVTLRRKLNNDLTPPRELVPTLSEPVDWAIRRAIQMDPLRRFASCLEFIQSLTGEGDPRAARAAEARPAAKRARPSEERRRSVRYPCTLASVCEVQTSIHPEETTARDQWKATVLNLSVSGIGLLLDRRFEPGTVVSTLLESPDHVTKIQVELRIHRSLKAGVNQWFIGAAFGTPLKREDVRKLL